MLRIHASYHKCLTMYFIRSVSSALNKYAISPKKQYEHFESIEGLFYNRAHRYFLCSINSFAPQLNHLKDDFRMTRFVRDPRDLIVSGYFYHKRGAEPWFRFKNPTEKYWAAINGHIPEKMSSSHSFTSYLNTLNKEEGLLAETEFRKNHLESMLEWPEDPRIKVFRYEDIMHDQVGTFKAMLNHLEIGGWKRKKILFFAERYSINNRIQNDAHIRNPNAGQWRSHFSEALNEQFIHQYSEILERYNYSKF